MSRDNLSTLLLCLSHVLSQHFLGKLSSFLSALSNIIPSLSKQLSSAVLLLSVSLSFPSAAGGLTLRGGVGEQWGRTDRTRGREEERVGGGWREGARGSVTVSYGRGIPREEWRFRRKERKSKRERMLFWCEGWEAGRRTIEKNKKEVKQRAGEEDAKECTPQTVSSKWGRKAKLSSVVWQDGYSLAELSSPAQLNANADMKPAIKLTTFSLWCHLSSISLCLLSSSWFTARDVPRNPSTHQSTRVSFICAGLIWAKQTSKPYTQTRMKVRLHTFTLTSPQAIPVLFPFRWRFLWKSIFPSSVFHIQWVMEISQPQSIR